MLSYELTYRKIIHPQSVRVDLAIPILVRMIANQIFDVSISKSELFNLFNRFTNNNTVIGTIPATPNGASSIFDKYHAL